MRTIIKITKQEAIDAWKELNYEKVKDKNIVVEIEEETLLNSYNTNLFNQRGLTPLTFEQPGNRCGKCGGIYYTSYHTC